MKPILPTLRDTKRYVVVGLLTGTQSSAHEIAMAVKESIARLFGSFGMAETGFMEVGSTGKKPIIRVKAKSLAKLKAAVAFTTQLSGRPAVLRTERVTGILAKTKQGGQ